MSSYARMSGMVRWYWLPIVAWVAAFLGYLFGVRFARHRRDD
jgi:uncharacterized membrane protein YfcA